MKRFSADQAWRYWMHDEVYGPGSGPRPDKEQVADFWEKLGQEQSVESLRESLRQALATGLSWMASLCNLRTYEINHPGAPYAELAIGGAVYQNWGMPRHGASYGSEEFEIVATYCNYHSVEISTKPPRNVEILTTRDARLCSGAFAHLSVDLENMARLQEAARNGWAPAG